MTALLVSLFLVGAGAIGTYVVGGFLGEVIEVRSWETTTCRVDDLWLEDPPFNAFVVRGRFLYRWEGVNYSSEHISLTDISYHDTFTDTPNVDGFNEGTELDCLVNPDQPEEALLLEPLRLSVWLAWPALFMAIAMFIGGVLMCKNVVLGRSAGEPGT